MAKIATPKTHYQRLGVDPNATTAEIDDAYEKIEDRYLPEEGARFERLLTLWGDIRTVNAYIAHDTLTDPIKRSQYDRVLEVFESARYLNEIRRIHMLRNVFIGIACTVVILIIPVWLVQPEMTGAVFKFGTFSWIPFILGIFLAILIVKIQNRLVRSRWRDLEGTVVFREIQRHVSWLVLWILFTVSMSSILLTGLTMA